MWREGLVSGNGETGADVYGGVKDETVMLTHSDLWHNGRAEELPYVSEGYLEAGTFRALLKAVRAHTVWLQLPSYVTDYELKQRNCQCRRENGLLRLEMQQDGELVITRNRELVMTQKG